MKSVWSCDCIILSSPTGVCPVRTAYSTQQHPPPPKKKGGGIKLLYKFYISVQICANVAKKHLLHCWHLPSKSYVHVSHIDVHSVVGGYIFPLPEDGLHGPDHVEGIL
jgi:hypothetical protein